MTYQSAEALSRAGSTVTPHEEFRSNVPPGVLSGMQCGDVVALNGSARRHHSGISVRAFQGCRPALAASFLSAEIIGIGLEVQGERGAVSVGCEESNQATLPARDVGSVIGGQRTLTEGI
jgi:hypothetical protein